VERARYIWETDHPCHHPLKFLHTLRIVFYVQSYIAQSISPTNYIFWKVMRGTLTGTVVTAILASTVTYAVEQNRSRALITNA
jgi:hypothetical protein